MTLMLPGDTHFRRTEKGPIACGKPVSMVKLDFETWVSKDVTKVTCKECTRTPVVRKQAKGELEKWK